jgi:hypothetical protein
MRAFVDFDLLKHELADAERLLAERHKRRAAALRAFDRPAFLAELRDLVARGFPVNARAASRNRAYRDSIASVGAALGTLFDDSGRFEKINGQLRYLKDKSQRIYWYAMQVLWNSFDFELAGIDNSRGIALRYLALIDRSLVDLGFVELRALFEALLGEDRRFSGSARTGASER